MSNSEEQIKPGIYTIHNERHDMILDYDEGWSKRIQQNVYWRNKAKFWQIEAAGGNDLIAIKSVQFGKYLKPLGIKDSLRFQDEPYAWRIHLTGKQGRYKIEHGSDKGQMLDTGYDPKPESYVWSAPWEEWRDWHFYWTFRKADMNEKEPGPLEVEYLRRDFAKQRNRADEAEKRAAASEQKNKDLEKKTADAEKGTVEAEKRTGDAEQRANDAEKRATEAEEKANSADQKIKDSEDRASNAEKKVADAEKTAADATQRVSELEGQLKNEKATSETSQSKQQQLESTISQLKDQATKAESAQKSAEDQLKEQEQEINDLKQQLEEAKSAQSNNNKPNGAAAEDSDGLSAQKAQQLKDHESHLQQKEADLTKREAQIKQAETDRTSAPHEPNGWNSKENAPGYMPQLDSDCAFRGDHLFCYSAHQNHEFTFLPRLR